MSQVLAIKQAGTKRPFDDMSMDQPSAACSPHRISFLTPPPAAKRFRATPASSFTSRSRPSSPSSSPATASPTTSQTNPSPHQQKQQQRPPSREQTEEMLKHVPKKLRKTVLTVLQKGTTSHDKIFTIEDVKEIVESVLNEKEKGLKEEYERVMQERLTDQWKVFVRYHEDFVARSYRGRELSYLS